MFQITLYYVPIWSRNRGCARRFQKFSLLTKIAENCDRSRVNWSCKQTKFCALSVIRENLSSYRVHRTGCTVQGAPHRSSALLFWSGDWRRFRRRTNTASWARATMRRAAGCSACAGNFFLKKNGKWILNSSYSKSLPDFTTLGIRQAQRDTTSCQVHLGT